ncbi:MAG: phage major capsid protein [Oscillospiraceae bacterium]|nr:phage major capsid protein [Oscillospiraceae bacterium]
MNKEKILKIIADKEEARKKLDAQKAELETRSETVEDEAELRKMVTESKKLSAELREIDKDLAEFRAAVYDLNAFEERSHPKGGLDVISVYGGAGYSEKGGATEKKELDPLDTPEYRNAFMNYVCRGVPLAAEFRANQKTTLGEVGAVIPTTLMHEIIRELKSYGNIYNKVRRLNVQGGVEFPILTLKPVAKWVGEGKSDDQKIAADQNVVFSYYGLECKIAQTLLVSVVTYAAFQAEFVPLATEALVHALEVGIFNGSGSGQMKGITKDNRVPEKNIVTLSNAEFTAWSGWMKKVFAKMKKSYRNGIFVMAQGTFDGYINGMVDANGQPIGRINFGITDGETYRFGGKLVETVEDDIIAPYDDAVVGEVVAVFFKPTDYAINSNMEMTVTEWVDHDDNLVKTKAKLICDGKLLDPNGVIIIKKGTAGA